MYIYIMLCLYLLLLYKYYFLCIYNIIYCICTYFFYYTYNMYYIFFYNIVVYLFYISRAQWLAHCVPWPRTHLGSNLGPSNVPSWNAAQWFDVKIYIYISLSSPSGLTLKGFSRSPHTHTQTHFFLGKILCSIFISSKIYMMGSLQSGECPQDQKHMKKSSMQEASISPSQQAAYNDCFNEARKDSYEP